MDQYLALTLRVVVVDLVLDLLLHTPLSQLRLIRCVRLLIINDNLLHHIEELFALILHEIVGY